MQFSKCLEKYQIYNFFSMILETDRTISGAAAFNNLQLIPSVHNNFFLGIASISFHTHSSVINGIMNLVDLLIY